MVMEEIRKIHGMEEIRKGRGMEEIRKGRGMEEALAKWKSGSEGVLGW